MQIVNRHAVYVAGATAGWQTALWALSSPAVTAVQLKMLSDLSHHYEIEFAQDIAKPLVLSLAGGVLSYAISRLPLLMIMKALLLAVPVVGVPLRFASGPAIMAVYTYFLGKAFVQHYESGGNLADFNRAAFIAETRKALGLGRPAPAPASV
jgi:hypothetical protein